MEYKMIKRHNELNVYYLSFNAAHEIHELVKSFPKEELYSLSNQIRRSSRSVAANIAEAFRKRRYPNAFIAKLSDSEAEAAETQVWLEFAYKFEYIDYLQFQYFNLLYENIIGKIVTMINSPEKWKIKS